MYDEIVWRFCVSLCGGGRYSPFDTIWVGIGVAAEAVSAPATRRCSRSLSQEPIVIPPIRARMAGRTAKSMTHVQYRRPDSTGHVKQSDLLLRMRIVERMNRLGGGLH